MKKTCVSRIPVLLRTTGFLILVLISSCDKKESGDEINISKEKISGYVQKGPYNIGTSITLSELTENLSQTGKTFSASIGDNLGSFEISNIGLSSQFVELINMRFNPAGPELSSISYSMHSAKVTPFLSHRLRM